MHIEDRAFEDINESLNGLWSCLVRVIAAAAHVDASLYLPNGPKSKPLNRQKAEVKDCCCHYNLSDIFIPMRIKVRIYAL